MGGMAVGAVDYEKLRIENQQQSEILRKRNAELPRLRLSAGRATQVCRCIGLAGPRSIWRPQTGTFPTAIAALSWEGLCSSAAVPLAADLSQAPVLPCWSPPCQQAGCGGCSRSHALPLHVSQVGVFALLAPDSTPPPCLGWLAG